MEITSLKETKDAPVRISRIHFLIHPGFCTDPDMMEMSPERIPLFEPLLDKYKDSARKMRPDELMLVFTHSTRKELKEDMKKGKKYVLNLIELKRILKKRMVLLSGNFDITDKLDDVRSAIEEIKRRGYIFDENTETVAYGETLGVCLTDGAENLNKVAGFKKKTKVISELSDFAIVKPQDVEAQKRRLSSDLRGTFNLEYGDLANL